MGNGIYEIKKGKKQFKNIELIKELSRISGASIQTIKTDIKLIYEGLGEDLVNKICREN